MQTRDIIVIGASMGGIEALSALVRQLPGDLPAAVFVVQHTSVESPAILAEILNRAGALPAVTAEDRMPLQRGRIYVAPPNRHLLLDADGIRVGFGPRENRSRPAIDPLFRTAAVHYGSRVIGLILTGLLGDGSAGLVAVKQCGGAALVQSPDDAAYPEMPARALAAAGPVPQPRLAELGQMLVRLAAEPAPEAPAVPEVLRVEARLTERAMTRDEILDPLGTPTNFTCPECHGAIQELKEGGVSRFRCRVGHSYSPQDWLAEKGKSAETSLWVAMQTLQERAEMLDGMANDDQGRGWMRGAAAYADRARETRGHAERLRELLSLLAE